MCSSKDLAVRFTRRTVELRFFDAPKDLNQLIEHLAIANGIVRLAKYRKESCYKEDRDFDFSNLLPEDTSINELKDNMQDFIEGILGISVKPYYKYIENFKERRLNERHLD